MRKNTSTLRMKTPPSPLDPAIIPTSGGRRYFDGATEMPLSLGATGAAARDSSADDSAAGDSADGGGYDPAVAWWLAEACCLAYCPEDAVRRALAAAGFSDVRLIEAAGLRCVLAADDDTVIAAFRGTDVRTFGGFRDVVTSMDASLVPARAGHGHVHRGFSRALHRVWDGFGGLRASLEALRKGGTPGPLGKPPARRRLLLTGHSMGAAEAVLAAAGLEEVDVVYTFGSPRFATRKFSEGLRMPVYRLVHNRDPIAYLPPNTGGRRFAHTGTLIEYTSPRVPPGILNNHSPVYYAVAAWNDAVRRIGGEPRSRPSR